MKLMADTLDELIDTVVFELKLLNNATLKASTIKDNIFHDKDAKVLSLENYPLIFLPKSVELLDIDTLVLSNTPKNLDIFDLVNQVVLYPHLKFHRARVSSGNEYLLITNSDPIEAQRLDYIHPSLYKMSNLTKLSMSFRCIEEISDEIKYLTKLNYLDLSHNKITELPDEIGELKELGDLDLSYNPLEFLPNGITELSELYLLNLSYTRIGTWDEDKRKFTLSVPNDDINKWVNDLIHNPKVEIIF